MKNHLAALKEGMTIKSPRYDFVTCESNPDGDRLTVTATIASGEKKIILNGVLENWDADAVDPCSWTMVTCSAQSLVIGL